MVRSSGVDLTYLQHFTLHPSLRIGKKEVSQKTYNIITMVMAASIVWDWLSISVKILSLQKCWSTLLLSQVQWDLTLSMKKVITLDLCRVLTEPFPEHPLLPQTLMAWDKELMPESFVCTESKSWVYSQALLHKIKEGSGNELKKLWPLRMSFAPTLQFHGW